MCYWFNVFSSWESNLLGRSETGNNTPRPAVVVACVEDLINSKGNDRGFTGIRRLCCVLGLSHRVKKLNLSAI